VIIFAKQSARTKGRARTSQGGPACSIAAKSVPWPSRPRSACPVADARAFDESKYPDFAGQLAQAQRAGHGAVGSNQAVWAIAQKAPLKPEFQAALEASLKDQTLGGQGDDARYSCLPNGMPRIMTVVWPIEIVITPKITYIMFRE